jgi:uncharacterized cupredoxin-like copper-binding protein
MENTMLPKLKFRFFLSLSLLLLAACSTVNAKPNPNNPITVKITAGEFYFKSSLTKFAVGQRYRFEVTNKGKVPHEIMLIAPIQPGAMSMDAMDKMAVAHITEEDLQSGVTKSFDYAFTKADAAGKLEFACHVPGHYEAGMKLQISVK